MCRRISDITFHLSIDLTQLDSVFVCLDVWQKVSNVISNIYIRYKMWVKTFFNANRWLKWFSASLQLPKSIFQIPFLKLGSPLAVVSLFDPTVFIYTVFLSHIPSQWAKLRAARGGHEVKPGSQGHCQLSVVRITQWNLRGTGLGSVQR